MPKILIGVFIEHEITAGGNYHQSLNNILLLAKINLGNAEFKIITTSKNTFRYLNTIGISSILYAPSKISSALMLLRSESSQYVYPFFRFLSSKNHIERFLTKNRIELVYFTSQSTLAKYLEVTNYIYTLFDLCHRDQPEFPEVSDYRVFQKRERAFIRDLPRAISVLVDSDIGKDNVISHYGLKADRVHVYPFKPSISIKDPKKINIKEKYSLNCDYIFYPAQFWPHKNHIYILEALKHLRDTTGVTIGAIFAGGDKGNLQHIRQSALEMKISDSVVFAGYVENDEIPSLYSQAFALVMPTYFGPTNLPPLEAFSLGVPVLYSDLPGLREQVADAAMLLDLTSPQSLSSHLFSLYESPQLRDDLIEKGLKRIEYLDVDNHRIEVLKKIIKGYMVKKKCWS